MIEWKFLPLLLNRALFFSLTFLFHFFKSSYFESKYSTAFLLHQNWIRCYHFGFYFFCSFFSFSQIYSSLTLLSWLPPLLLTDRNLDLHTALLDKLYEAAMRLSYFKLDLVFFSCAVEMNYGDSGFFNRYFLFLLWILRELFLWFIPSWRPIENLIGNHSGFSYIKLSFNLI